MKVQVIIDIDIEGFHLWEKAPKEVEFLKNLHRHLFNIKMWFSVNDLDRELEIFILQNAIKSFIKEKWGEPAMFMGMSCEMIGVELLNQYKDIGAVEVEVTEDKKGGARVTL